ncbi:MAG TPA: ClpXP protease specificity-enhancing factor SspB [Thermoanaerobaculia bacterium]|nr:ClpXP protease specificity-enhancing factor SspB [Thermoanaerobaculia bacterium]
MSSDSIDYQRFVEDGLRDAVRRLLAHVAEQGLPGDHYFYIGFHTGHPGVVMPRSLRDLYPEDMTLVLQHQFWNLEVDDVGFAVELSFSGSRQRLTIPFAALTIFADPTAEFALRFMPRLPGAVEATGVTARLPGAAAAAVASPPGRGVTASPSPPPGGGKAPPSPQSPPSPPTGAPGPGGPASPRSGPGDVIRFDPSRRK